MPLRLRVIKRDKDTTCNNPTNLIKLRLGNVRKTNRKSLSVFDKTF